MINWLAQETSCGQNFEYITLQWAVHIRGNNCRAFTLQGPVVTSCINRFNPQKLYFLLHLAHRVHLCISVQQPLPPYVKLICFC